MGNGNKRLTEIRESLKGKGVDGFLVTDVNNVRYLTGFTGSSGFLLITKTKDIFATDFRYKEQAETEVRGWDILIEKGERTTTVSRLLTSLGIDRLGFESSVSYEFFRKLSIGGFKLRALKNIVERLRAIKDHWEVNLIREAVRRAESAFIEVRPHIKAGVKEKEIALRLEERLKKMGCNRIPFDIIVASGVNSSMPHAKTTEKRLNAGDLVVIDWGGEAGGYFSDMTRTLLMKGANIARKKEIYQAVLEANKKAVSAISPGIESKKIDNSARDIIKKAGYSEFFGHGTGHGIGLAVHESPHITWTKKETIRENMIFTVEPGVYVPGVGGVRIEDMVVVGKKKADLLTTLPRELEII